MLLFSLNVPLPPRLTNHEKSRAYLPPPGFEEIELMAPLDILRRLNMDVVLAGVQSDKVVSTHEVTVSTATPCWINSTPTSWTP